MLSYNEALKIIRDAAAAVKPATETVSLPDAAGRICAANVAARLDIQPFDNSAMDGFAVRLGDFAGVPPVRLRKAGIVAAGADAAGLRVENGDCWHVMTGAMLPAGTETIIPVEDSVMDGDFVSFAAAPEPGRHIRRAGEDFKKGAPVLAAGTRMTAAHILPLATLGVAEVEVFRKPRVLFLPTGTEIVDDLNAPLGPGQIYNSNKYYARAFLTACGADVTARETIRDDPDHFIRILAEAETNGYDMIVSSGAVSAGSYDFVKDALEKAGARILFHKIKLKPGKPNLLAVLPSGALYFGLPGNPVSTAAGLRFFVAEALRVMQGRPAEIPAHARSMNKFVKKGGLHTILKGRMEYWEDGSVTVDILDGQESFRVSPFLDMNCWIHVPEEMETVRSGDPLETYPLLP